MPSDQDRDIFVGCCLGNFLTISNSSEFSRHLISQQWLIICFPLSLLKDENVY